jgi:hypothetical protein
MGMLFRKRSRAAEAACMRQNVDCRYMCDEQVYTNREEVAPYLSHISDPYLPSFNSP